MVLPVSKFTLNAFAVRTRFRSDKVSLQRLIHAKGSSVINRFGSLKMFTKTQASSTHFLLRKPVYGVNTDRTKLQFVL